MRQTHKLPKFVSIGLWSFLFLSAFASLPQPAYAPSPFTTLNAFGNWTWDSANKIMTIVANATANAGNTEANAYGFQDIVNAIGLRGWTDAFYNRSYSGTQFEFNFRIVLGDGSGTTWFVDSAKQVTWLSTVADTIFTVQWNSRLRLGILEDLTTKRTSRGCNLISLNTANNLAFMYINGYAYIYSSNFYKAGAFGTIAGWGGLQRIWNCLLSGRVIIGPENGNVYNVIIQKLDSDAIQALTSTSTYDKIYVSDAQSKGMVYSTAGNIWTVTNAYARGTTYIATMENGFSGRGYLVNVDSDVWGTNWLGTTTGEIYRQYTFDLIATYPDGTAFANAAVTISNNVEGVIYEGTTDENGQIPQQTLTMGFYNQTGGNTIYSYNPFWLNATSTDGSYIYYKSWTVENLANWEIALLPITIITEENSAKYMLLGAMLATPIMLALALHQRKRVKSSKTIKTKP